MLCLEFKLFQLRHTFHFLFKITSLISDSETSQTSNKVKPDLLERDARSSRKTRLVLEGPVDR